MRLPDTALPRRAATVDRADMGEEKSGRPDWLSDSRRQAAEVTDMMWWEEWGEGLVTGTQIKGAELVVRGAEFKNRLTGCATRTVAGEEVDTQIRAWVAALAADERVVAVAAVALVALHT